MDFSKIFPNLKKTTEKELKDKEKSLSVGDHVSVVKNIRCKQAGKSGVITKINPEDKHGWKSFVVKFDDNKYGSMAFQSGNLNKTASEKYESGYGKVESYTKDKTKDHDEIVIKLKDGRTVRISNNTKIGVRVEPAIGSKINYHGYRIKDTNVIHKVHPNKHQMGGWLENEKVAYVRRMLPVLLKTAQAYDKKKWPKYDDFQKERHDKAVELAKKIIEEHYKKMRPWGAKTEKGFLANGKVNTSNMDDVIIRGGKNILKQRRGTCHELSNARLKLLRDAGIDAHRVFNFYGVGKNNDGLLGHSMVIFCGDDGKLHFANPHMADKKKRTSFGDFDSIEDAVNQYMAVMKDKDMGGEFSDDDFVEIHDTTDMDIPDKIKFRDFLYKALKGKLLYSQGR